MSHSRNLRFANDTGAALACPRCGATQLLHRSQRVWHCDICRTLLLRTHKLKSRSRRGHVAAQTPVIVAFDSWLRAELAIIAFLLVALGIAGAVPAAAANAAFGTCTMFLAATFITDAAGALRAKAVMEKMGFTFPRRIIAKAGAALFLGCWALFTGLIIFHLSQQMIAITDRAAALPDQRHPSTLAAQLPEPTLPSRKSKP